MSDIETKQKIMQVATVLFADHGYDGTSIRDIAKLAEVNVASVNYYFSSKEKLFQEILKSGYKDCSEEVKKLFEKNQGNLEESLVDSFRYFLERHHNLISHFKMMMTAQHSHYDISEGTEDASFGPPGGMTIAEALRKECPYSNDEDIHWGLKTLFSHITHLSLIQSCCMKNNKDVPFSSIPDLEKGIRRLTRLVLQDLKVNKSEGSL